MSEPNTTTSLPCPCCGSTNITRNEWTVDEDHARQFDADEHSEIWAFECNDCLAAAPIQSWQKRADPWRRPPDMPADGQRIVQTYRQTNGEESREFVGIWNSRFAEHWRPLVRWMPVPQSKGQER